MAESTALDRIRIVLVNTTHPGNIGGVARAMKNMGLNKLYLVEPKRFPDEEAVWRSGHASDVLDDAIVTRDLDEALEGCGLVIGTSARERRIPWPLMNPREAAAECINEKGDHDVAIVFGREDRGLTNEELQKCHLHLNIPTNDEYSSLNLAAAVQVVAYELRMTALGDGLPSMKADVADKREWDVKPASSGAMELFFDHLQQVLVDIEFLDLNTPRQTMTRMRRLFNRVRMDEMELAMMRGILRNIQRVKQRADKAPEND
ncbi:tRNA (cytidine/uridine-2'-O-)-methyltransferase TrmJ [BD1-7 clade bacterium]|uniref:tRNA (cytidine/uridine-2'-O-)-methyltransferase TrmJ n=1 Tax=BD1-7 clade bacterium TaxID=2029982 RepID=A0A5S9MZ86_9GAMM|nr:tRNA (cytidine/uridine-2'-O-)-methyltransferase TrmJ [BD1-7 clade bacterium]